jgi:adenylate cyclase
MPNLVARDLKHREVVRHSWSLVDDVDLPLGRAVRKDQLCTAWDKYIAPWHAVLRSEQGRLVIKRRDEANADNAIYYNGLERDEFSIVPGEGFVIGRTIFQLQSPRTMNPDTGRPSSSRTQLFELEQLKTQLDASNDELQTLYALIRQVQDRQMDVNGFESHVVKTLRSVVKRADFAGIVQLLDGELLLYQSDGACGICQPLVMDAVQRQKVISHSWGTKSESTYPAVDRASWAVCAPILSNIDSEGVYAVYLSGARAPVSDSKSSQILPNDQLAFVAIVADILQTVRAFSHLAKCRQSIEGFIPKAIRELIHDQGPQVLNTEEVEAAVLFCDLRGSSRFAEQKSHDLSNAWRTISEALSVMTAAITNQSGSIGDFQGDAAMGFWGWPKIINRPNRLSDDVQAACQAADNLRERFEQRARDNGPLADFACGIGIAAGPVVAGVLGTLDQRKIGVFGPAVNLAARLESMTKQLGASILIDGASQDALCQSHSTLSSRLRYLGKIQPIGMAAAVRVYELMLPSGNPLALTKNQRKLFEFGQLKFEQGKWDEAREPLQQLATAGDGPSRFLVETIGQLRAPPEDWTGCVVLTSK